MALPGRTTKDPALLVVKLLDQYYGKDGNPLRVGQLGGVGGMFGDRRRYPGHNKSTPPLNDQERADLIRSFIGVYEKRQDLVKSLNSLRTMDVAQTVIDVIIDDGFKGKADEDIFTVKWEPPKGKVSDDIVKKFNDEIQWFCDKVRLQKFTEDSLEDMLLLGEYPFTIVKANEKAKRKGIVSLEDDLDPANVVGFYRRMDPSFFLEKKGSKAVVHGVDEVFHFCMSPRKVRINVADMHMGCPRQLPEYIRVGRSVFYPAIQKMKRLQVYELASVAKNLADILTPQMVNVAAPAEMSPDDAAEMVRRYERMIIENRVPINPEGPLDFGDLLEAVGRVKVLPSYADGKGAVSKVDLKSDNGTDTDTEDALRRGCANALGVPFYYLTTKGEQGSGKLATLKGFSRYTRKLISVQDSAAYTIKYLVKLHLKLRGFFVDERHLKVEFKQMVSSDILDNMELAVAGTQMLQDMANVMDQISQSGLLRVKARSGAFVRLFNKVTRMVGNEDLLEVDDSPQEEVPAGERPTPKGPGKPAGPGGEPGEEEDLGGGEGEEEAPTGEEGGMKGPKPVPGGGVEEPTPPAPAGGGSIVGQT